MAFSLILFLSTLFPISVFAQTNDDTETPDTSWFTDVTNEVGLNITNVGAVIAVDVNNDDFPDLIMIDGQDDTALHLFLNEQRPGSNSIFDRVFVNATANSGLQIPGVVVGLAGAADFNNDGNVDLIVNTWYDDSVVNSNGDCVPNPDTGQNRCRIFLGDGKGHFTLEENSGLEQLGPNYGTGLPMLDYNRDGNLDLYVCTQFRNWCYEQPFGSHLMEGNGDGTFTDVTQSSGIQKSQKDPSKPWLTPPPTRGYYGANVSDWNNDCWPDILALPYEAIGYPFTADHCLYNYGTFDAYAPCNGDTEDTRGYANLYENNGNNTFTDVGVSANFDPHFAWADQGMVPWAAMPGDYNNDGNMDYLMLEVHGANNPVTGEFAYPNEPGYGRTIILTNMGPDSNYKFSIDPSQIVRNNPENITHGDHNGFWCDFNNDGWPDLMIGDAAYAENGYPDNQRMFFELQDTITHNFRDITHDLGFITGTGIDSLSTNSILHKIRRPSVMIPVDYDMDGADDIIKCPYNTPEDSMLVLHNNVGTRNNHITIKLVAPSGVNKSCIGARIRVVSGKLKQMKDIYGCQGSQTNEYPFIQNFGLGKRTHIDTIDVRWPDNNCTHTIITDSIPINSIIRIDSSGISGITPVTHYAPNDFTLYPNPDAGNNLYIRFQAPINPFIEIYNELGQQVLDYKPGYSSSFTLSVGSLPGGLYFVHVIGSNSSSVLTEPFVKTNQQ